MMHLLKEIRSKLGPLTKICLMWDNATLHRAREVKELAASPDVDIKLVYNVPYRPDLATVGVEKIFRRAKHIYRSRVDHFKAMN